MNMRIFEIILFSGLLITACTPDNSNQTNKPMMKTIMKEHVKSTASVKLPSVLVWNKLIAFGGTEKFVPDLLEKVIVEGDGIGAVRTISLKGGGEIVEELTKIDETKHQMTFVVLSTPMPVYNYEGTFTIRSINKDECAVDFESIYEVSPENKQEMNKVIKGFQETFISNLHK